MSHYPPPRHAKNGYGCFTNGSAEAIQIKTKNISQPPGDIHHKDNHSDP
jgi:hypothetical protein